MYLTIFDLFAYISSIYIGKKDAVKQFTARFLHQPIKKGRFKRLLTRPKRGIYPHFLSEKGNFRARQTETIIRAFYRSTPLTGLKNDDIRL